MSTKQSRLGNWPEFIMAEPILLNILWLLYWNLILAVSATVTEAAAVPSEVLAPIMTSLGNLHMLLKLLQSNEFHWILDNSDHPTARTRQRSVLPLTQQNTCDWPRMLVTSRVDWRGICKWGCYCENYNLSMYGASFSIMSSFLVLSRHTPSHLSHVSHLHFFDVNSRKAFFHVAFQCMIVFFILEE